MSRKLASIRKGARGLAALAAAAGAVLAASATLAQGRFTYRPPDSTSFVETTTTRTSNFGPARKSVSTLRGKMRRTIKKTANGYTIAETLTSCTYALNGRTVENPLFSSLVGATVSYDVDAKGAIRNIRGFQEIGKRASKALPPQAGAQLSGFEKEMADELKRDWRGTIGMFVGQPARPGQTWKSTESVSLPLGGTAVVPAVTRCVGVVRQGGRSSLRLRASYNDRATTKKQLEKRLRPGARPVGGAKAGAKVLAAQASGTREWIVDPLTMLVFHKAENSSVTMTIAVPGQKPIKGTFTSRTEEKYSYRK